jgi:hypothetical protein
MVSKSIAVGVISLGMLAGAAGVAGVAAANPIQPAPNAVGPYIQGSVEPTGKSQCLAAAAKAGNFALGGGSNCFPYPNNGTLSYPNLKYYYNPAS